MPKIIGDLGLDVDKARYETTFETDGVFIMSYIYRVRLRFGSEANGRGEELSMILKRPMGSLNEKAHIDLQFHNEILFYRTYVQPGENYARFLYAVERPPGDSVIALENVNERGYYSCPRSYDPPLEYTLAAMRELGRFHGKGYAMKELQRERFFGIVAEIRQVRYAKGTGKHYEFYTNIQPLRAVEYLRGQGYDATFCDKMEAVLSNSFDQVMTKTIQPVEPLATLCHGDFTLNNILFKTEADGRHRPMLIDFALITYSTPVVDLSTYLYCSCSNELRKEKFSEIMRAYHDALREYLLDVGVQDIERYSYDALLDDFKKGALFGFVIMSFFIPVLLGYFDPKMKIQEALELGSLESSKRHKQIGGDEVSKMLADALLELKDLGYLDHVL